MLCRFEPGSGHQERLKGLVNDDQALSLFTIMSDETLQRLLKRFAAAAEAHATALETMDAASAERHVVMLDKLFAAIVHSSPAGREALLQLAEDYDGAAAGMAAVYSLRYRSERALAVLRRLAAKPGLLGFRASVAVERWEQGEWEAEEGKV